MPYEKILPEIISLARAAGYQILKIYDTDFEVDHKQDESPLTAADLAAHRCIVDGLKKLRVQWPILSEESATTRPFSERASWSPYWLVDPLDGTKEFVKRNGEFTVNIALIEGHKPVLGVVHVPVTGVTYFAAQGHGAFRKLGTDEPVAIRVHDQARTPRVVGSRSHRGPLIDQYLENLGAHEMVPMGSSLKFCVVAEGGADVYPRLGPTSEWDTAAAHAVINGAGGRVVHLDGSDLTYNAKEDILNPHFMVLGNPTANWLDYLP